MSLTRLAVHRPVTTLMTSLIVILLGGIALRQLPIDLMPDFTWPTISVTTLYEGAGPAEIETLITRPLEQALRSVHGAERIFSNSTEGSSSVRVRFRWDTNLDSAIGDMRAKIERVRGKLPEGADAPYIRRYDVTDSPVIYMGLSADLDPIQLTQFAEKDIAPRLESTDGVARAMVRGASRREIQVNLDRQKLESLNMSVSEVVDVLKRENVNQPAGNFEQGNLKLLIRSHGDFQNLEEVSHTVVRANDAAVVRLGDIADVIDGEEERTELTRVNGEPGLLIYIFMQAGANKVEVSDRVRERMAQINRSLKNGELTLRLDKSDYIRQSISNVRRSALYGMGLAIVVLVIFLRSFRSTLVIGIAMPLSVLATFVIIYFKGFSLNMVSFGGLALGMGLLVDNSIVVIESIFRKLDDGIEAKQAAVEGTDEVASAIIASTLTTLIVFVPLVFAEGMTAIILHQLAWVVSISLLCSLLTSLTLTPVLVAYWIRRRPQSAGDPATHRSPRATRVLHALNRRVLSTVERFYGMVLGLSLRHAGIVAFLLLAAFSLTVGLSPRVGTEYMPKADEGDLRLYTEMAPGIQLDQLDEKTRLIERSVEEVAGKVTESTAVTVGGDANDGDSWNRSYVRMNLVPRSQRDRGADTIRKQIVEHIGSIPGMEYRLYVTSQVSVARMLASSTGGNGGLVVEVRGFDLDDAEQLAKSVEEVMKGTAGLVNVKRQAEDRRPEMAANIDRSKASLLGVSVRDITQTLETTIRGTDATIYREGGDEFQVVVRLKEDDRHNISDIEQVGVSTASGRIVPLKSLVNLNPNTSPVAIHRLDQERVTQLTADIEDRDLGSTVGNLQERLNELQLPSGFSLTIAGDWEEQQKSFSMLRGGLILAVVLMYMVMASQFESLLDPLLILVTIPLGAIGVILMLVLTGTSLNVQSYIGITMLSGIVVNNAIVLIDYINRLRRSEPDADIADIIRRAGLRRFRPILMTTLTTVMAMTPIALGWGEGGELQAPMARVVIGGLTSGTLITLLAIPLLAQFVHRRKARASA